MKFNISKKNITLLIVLIASIAIIAVSFAYFVARVTTPANTNVRVTTDTSEKVVISPGSEINLHASLLNFSENHGTLSATADPSIQVIAASTSDSATKTYSVHYLVSENDFEYTVDSNTAEVLLKITDPEGDEVLSVDGLNYKTVTDVDGASQSGFDITTFSGAVTIAENYSISTTDSVNGTTQSWSIEVIFVNLNSEQTLNEGKTLNSRIYLQEGKMSLSEAILYMDDGDNGLVEHASSYAASAADDNYRYSGGNDIVENYVCFGSDEVTCPKENLYRIMGVYDGNIKIIKAEPIDKNSDGTYDVAVNGADTFAFGGANVVNWEGTDSSDPSDDASINTYLNTTYYNAFPEKYRNMILASNYSTAGFDESNSATAKNYQLAQTGAYSAQTYNIALMSPGEYMFGANSNFWSLVSFASSSATTDYYLNTDMQANNWLYLDQYDNYLEWCINEYTSDSNKVWRVHYGGHVGGSVVTDALAVRPVITLSSDAKIEYGSGTNSNPYRLSL